MVEYETYYASGSACVFKKTYDDGVTSVFTVMVSPLTDGENKKTTIVFIDDRKVNEQGWFSTKNLNLDKVIEEFVKWGPDAPADYRRIIGDHMGRNLRTEERQSERKIETNVGTKGAGIKASHTRRKKL